VVLLASLSLIIMNQWVMGHQGKLGKLQPVLAVHPYLHKVMGL
jgi:hypothetical protein